MHSRRQPHFFLTQTIFYPPLCNQICQVVLLFFIYGLSWCICSYYGLRIFQCHYLSERKSLTPPSTSHKRPASDSHLNIPGSQGSALASWSLVYVAWLLFTSTRECVSLTDLMGYTDVTHCAVPVATLPVNMMSWSVGFSTLRMIFGCAPLFNWTSVSQNSLATGGFHLAQRLMWCLLWRVWHIFYIPPGQHFDSVYLFSDRLFSQGIQLFSQHSCLNECINCLFL